MSKRVRKEFSAIKSIFGPPSGNDGVPDSVGALHRVRLSAPQLSATMRRIADFVTTAPEEMLAMPITAAAIRTRTSPATITRFCRALGYLSLAQFRVAVAADLGREGAGSPSVAQPHRRDANVGSLVRGETEALEHTARFVNIDTMNQIARSIAECSHLDVYGVLGAAMIAGELQNRLYRIGINAHVWHDAHLGLASAAILAKGSVAIGISRRGRNAATVEMLSRAKASGAYTIALTSDPDSPLSEVAEVSLLEAWEAQGQSDELAATVSQLFIVNLLCQLVVEQSQAAARRTSEAARGAILSAPRSTGS